VRARIRVLAVTNSNLTHVCYLVNLMEAEIENLLDEFVPIARGIHIFA